VAEAFYGFRPNCCNFQSRNFLVGVGEPDWSRQTGSIKPKRRIVMKRVLLRSQVALLLAVSMLYAQSVVAQEESAKVKECSKATLWGSFGYTSTVTLLDSYVPAPYAGPFGEVGRQTFDGKGHTDATATTLLSMVTSFVERSIARRLNLRLSFGRWPNLHQSTRP
jgi:hypothetical protein